MRINEQQFVVMALSHRVERPALEPPSGIEVKKTCEARA
jgi:hypothetical protein